jgi:hypothetical protein
LKAVGEQLPDAADRCRVQVVLALSRRDFYKAMTTHKDHRVWQDVQYTSDTPLLTPGITGLASLKFRDEETLLALARDPQRYNHEIIFPEKVPD